MTEFLEGPAQDDNREASPHEPLDEHTMSVVREIIDVPSEAIPRDMMWARIQKARTASAPSEPAPVRPIATVAPRRSPEWMTRLVGIAALLAAGVGVGRYLLPASGPSKYQMAIENSAHAADSVSALGLGPEAIAAIEPANDPAHVAMEEHLVHTVALLMTVRDETPSAKATATMTNQARELLSTTRLLLDEPQLRDERTRRLLQDLELVLAQIIQARRSAPETQRAPNETMRETNLLPRVRAAVTATRRGDDLILGGDL